MSQGVATHPGDLDLADDGPEVGGQDDRMEFQQNQIVSSCLGLHLQAAQGAEINNILLLCFLRPPNQYEIKWSLAVFSLN